MIDDKQLISALLSSHRIDQNVLKKGLELAEDHQATLYDTLIAYDLVAEHRVVEAASGILNVPCVHLSELDIDRDTGQMIPAELASESQSLPLAVRNENGQQILKLAMADPIDVMAMDEIASYTGIDIHPVLVGPNDLRSAIERTFDDDEEEIIELDELDAIAIEEEVDEPLSGDQDDENYHMDHGSVDFSSYDEEDEDDGGLFAIEDDESAERESGIDFSTLDDDSASPDPSNELAAQANQDFDLNEPEGLGADEDSWATMFTSASEASEASEADKNGGDEFDFGSIPTDGDAGGTQIGSPAQLGEWSESDMAPGDSWEISDAYIEEVSEPEEQAPPEEDKPTQQPGRATRGTPMGLASRPGSPPSEPADDGPPSSDDKVEADTADESDDADGVPKSIRDVLHKTRQKNQKKKPSSSTSGDDSGAALGRIDVKKVAVPTFKGAVEKRSDRQSKKARPKPNTSGPALESNEKLELPADLDSDLLLRALVDLLVDKKIITRRELTALLEELV